MTTEIPKTMKATRVKTTLMRMDVILLILAIIYSFLNLMIFLITRCNKVLSNVKRVKGNREWGIGNGEQHKSFSFKTQNSPTQSFEHPLSHSPFDFPGLETLISPCIIVPRSPFPGNREHINQRSRSLPDNSSP